MRAVLRPLLPHMAGITAMLRFPRVQTLLSALLATKCSFNGGTWFLFTASCQPALRRCDTLCQPPHAQPDFVCSIDSSLLRRNIVHCLFSSRVVPCFFTRAPVRRL